MHKHGIRLLGWLILAFLLCGCSTEANEGHFQTLEDFAKQENVNFACAANNMCYSPWVLEDIPNVKFNVYTNYFDTFMEVANGKQDAALCFSSIFVGLKETYPTLECIVSDGTIPLAAAFSSGKEGLKEEFDAFILENPGLLAELKAKWVDDYGNNDLIVDFSTLENRNGEITFAVCPDSPPMEYVKNVELAGYEVDLIYQFAQHAGYSVNVVNADYLAVMTGIATGRYDVGVGIYGLTEERSEGMLFSVPIYDEHPGYVVLGVDSGTKADETVYFRTLEDFAKRERIDFANATDNMSYASLIQEDIPNVQFSTYTNYFDTFMEVANGKRDAALCFSSIFVGVKESYPSLECIVSPQTIPIVASFSNKNEELRQEFNAFLQDNTELLAQMKKAWVDDYGKNDLTVDFSDLENKNGVINFAVDLTSPPMEYIKNGQPAGYEVDLIYQFAKARGYAVNPIVAAYVSVMTGVATGKYDVSVGFYGYTEERSEGIAFSDPIYDEHPGYVVCGRDDEGSSNLAEQLWIRFEKNFLRESRWKLITRGLGVTVTITLLSVLFGSLFGFILFLLGRKYRLLQRLSFGIHEFFESLPTLVILLVFFYVIFGESSVSGFVVASGVFILLFSFTFFALLTGSVNGIAKGQTEAALALGYTPLQALCRIVIPQALVSFLPAYRSAIVGILKATAIVGYVAVQDLTSAGDRIRSLTFDALFPIMGITLIYFAIARLLIRVLNRILTIELEKNREKFLLEAEKWVVASITEE